MANKNDISLDTLARLKAILEASKVASTRQPNMEVGKAIYERMKSRGVPPRVALDIIIRSDIDVNGFDPTHKLWQDTINAVADHHANTYHAFLEIWGPVDGQKFVDTIQFALEVP